MTLFSHDYASHCACALPVPKFAAKHGKIREYVVGVQARKAVEGGFDLLNMKIWLCCGVMPHQKYPIDE
ncbi:hypothetical protein J4E91_007921 [Alternaria rosae]|nr:hypothetical protein J4E91_007921 [Alternaria rosae]